MREASRVFLMQATYLLQDTIFSENRDSSHVTNSLVRQGWLLPCRLGTTALQGDQISSHATISNRGKCRVYNNIKNTAVEASVQFLYNFSSLIPTWMMLRGRQFDDHMPDMSFLWMSQPRLVLPKRLLECAVENRRL